MANELIITQLLSKTKEKNYETSNKKNFSGNR